MNFAEGGSLAASEKGETCMDDFDVKHHDRELDDLLSEVKGLLGEEPEEDECPDESDAPDTPQEPSAP